MKRLTRFLIVCMVWFGVVIPDASALDYYDDDMASTTGWTASNVNGTFTAVTWEGASATKCYVATAGSGNYGGALRTLPVTGDVVRIELSIDPDVLGTIVAVNNFVISYYGGAYVTPIRFGTDGMTIGGAGELGTDIVDAGVKTNWTIILKNSNLATCSATVYKNGTYIGVLSNVSGASTAQPAGTIILRQQATTLNNATTYVDSIEVKSYGLNYFENCDDITDWTDLDETGTTSSQVTFDGVSAFKFDAPNSQLYRAMRRIDHSFAMPRRYIIETRVYHDTLGTNAESRRFVIGFPARLATYSNALYLCSDGLYTYTTAYTKIGSVTVEQDVWTTWRIFVDTSNSSSVGGNKSWYWKNGVLVASDVSTGYTTTGQTLSRQFIYQYSSTSGAGLTYVDYLRIYSEDGQLIQTIIE